VTMRSVARAVPALMRIGFYEAVAYRAEMLVWFLTTTMPLVMLALWSAVARDNPVGRFGQTELTAYFLTTFVIRQLVSSWSAWQMNYEIRHGTLSMRLLRPLPPVVGYAIENLAAIPLRLFLVTPVVIIMLVILGTDFLPKQGWQWASFVASLVGGWLIAFFSQFFLGALALFMQSSIKAIEVWFICFVLASGYLFPLELLPPGVQRWVDLLPFRYMLAVQVELANGLHDEATALRLLGGQWLWVALFAVLSWLVWTRGLRRFAAYGG
jgi:ABC-2 type transport system permease protein